MATKNDDVVNGDDTLMNSTQLHNRTQHASMTTVTRTSSHAPFDTTTNMRNSDDKNIDVHDEPIDININIDSKKSWIGENNEFHPTAHAGERKGQM